MLADHAHNGATVLFSSHQLDLVEHLCEAVAIVDQGRLVAAGAVEELTRGGQPRLAVRVAHDPEGRWTAQLAPGARVEAVERGTVKVAVGDGVDPDAVLDAARAAGRWSTSRSSAAAFPRCSVRRSADPRFAYEPRLVDADAARRPP